MRTGTVSLSGQVGLRKVGRTTQAPWAWWLRNLPYRLRGLPALWMARLAKALVGISYIQSTLSLRVRHADGRITNYGCVATRLVTDAGVAFIVDAFQNSVELENMKFHGFGTGVGAEAQGDTALGTELTTQYATDNVRPTGTTAEGASANIYQTVATLSPDSGGTIAITEHGVFSQAATGGGTLLDRSVFAAVNLVAGSDSLEATYELTLTAGG